MKILYLGYAVSATEADSLCGASVAGNKMQLNLICGFANNPNIDLKIITILPIAHFFRSKQFRVKSECFKVINDVKAKKISFINLPIIKTIGQIFSLTFELFKIVDSDTIVFTYNFFPQIGIPSRIIRKIKKNKLVSIIADPPIFDKGNKTGIFKKSYINISKKLLSKHENLIVLNKKIISTYSNNANFIVIEGGISFCDVNLLPCDQKKSDKKIIMYSGALTKYSGIMNLIQAVDMINDSQIELHIYGSGILEKDIKELSQKNIRIKCFGRVANDDILRLQRKAFLLVNPRIIDDPIAELTFPSKMFEYLASGTPVLSTCLNAYSDYFVQNIFTCGDTADELANKINDICNMDEELLKAKANRAQNFVINEMNWNVQNKKIYDFLRNIE